MSRRRPGERVSSARLYLRALADPALPARHSAGARTRAAHLVGFLAPLHEAATSVVPTDGEVSLIVAGSRDWALLCSHPYGLPFVRRVPGATVVIAAAEYPDRLRRRYDDLMLTAGRAGAAPGQLEEMLDLSVGVEWGHALLDRAGARAGVRWLDELVATSVLASALHVAGGPGGPSLLGRWAAVQVAATPDMSMRLEAFEYPRWRMRQAEQLYFQGRFARAAVEREAEAPFSLVRTVLAEASERRGHGLEDEEARRLLERAWPGALQGLEPTVSDVHGVEAAKDSFS